MCVYSLSFGIAVSCCTNILIRKFLKIVIYAAAVVVNGGAKGEIDDV